MTEIEGYHQITSRRRPGLSCMVIDRHANYRLIGAYRTEDHVAAGWTHPRMRAETRLLAHRHAERLNG